MFSGCESLKSLELFNFNVSLVKSMSHMFESCLSLRNLNLSNFESKSLENMEYMFSNSENLDYVNIENINDYSIKNYINAFYGTPENMVVCINPTNANKLNLQIKNTKGCTVIDCSKDWSRNRSLVRADNKKCVKECQTGYLYLYDFKCYELCPKDTFNFHFTCSKDFSLLVECDLKNYFLGFCKFNLTTNLETKKFVDKIINALLDSELDELLQQAVKNSEIYTVYDKNMILQLYALSNKKRAKNSTYINLDDCGDILKEKYNIDKSKDLIIFKIEYFTSYFKIPIIEYKIFSENGKKRYNLNYCNKKKAMYYIPKIINDYHEYKYNPEHKYYHDKCLLFETDEFIDLTIPDRKFKFNSNNMSLCESNCTYKGYTNQNIECECDIKQKFNSFLNVNSDKYNLIYRFEEDDSNPVNLYTIKCFLSIQAKGSLLFRGCSIFIFIILFLIIIGAIIFYQYEQKILLQKIRILLKGKFLNFLDDLDGNNEENKFKSNNEIVEEKNNIDEKEEDNKEKNDFEDNYENKMNNFIINIQKKGKNTDENKLDTQNINDTNSKNIGLDKINNKLKINKRRNVATKSNFSEQKTTSMNNSITNTKVTMFKSKNKYDNDKNILIEKIKYSFFEMSDYELSLLSYIEAIHRDKRKFLKQFFSLISSRFILLIVLQIPKKNNFDSKTIQICYFLFILVLYLVVNTLFVDMPSFHNLYLNNGKFILSSSISRIINATMICYFLQKMLALAFLTNSYIIQKKRTKFKIKNKNETMSNITYNVCIKCIMFFAVVILFLLLFWFYIGCFCIFFPKTQIYLAIKTIISIAISFIFSIIIILISAFVRFYSLKEHNREDIYRLSQFLQMI